MLIPNPVVSAAAARPDHAMIIHPGGTLTWGEGLDRVRRAAGALLADGAGPGGTVFLPATPTVETVVALHAIGWVGAVAALLPPGESPPPGARGLDPAGARSSGETPPAPERPWPMDEARIAVRTSGTTGAPRWASLTTGQLLLSAFASATRLGLDPADRWLCCLPLHHVGGLQTALRSAWYGTTLVLEPGFDPARVAAALDGGEATLVSLVPQMLARVLDARPPGRPFPPTLRVILLGGAPCPPELLARCRAIAAPVALTWGMTEAASQVATRFPGDLDDAPHSGPPLPFARVSEVGGRLSVQGPLVGSPVVTTDEGGVDGSGRIVVGGRADDAIVSGGEKIQPGPIEDALRAHPAIEDAAVVGAPSARWGQRPVAFVVRSAPVTEAALIAWCRERVGPIHAPDRIRAVAAIPRTALGKARRRLLLDESDLAQGVEQAGGGGDGLEGLRVHDGVHEPRGGAQRAVDADEAVAERQRALPPLDELQRDREPVPHADGALEVGLGVHERRGPLGGLERGLEAPERGGPQLFVRHVAVLEDAPEEHDAGPVHFVEPRRELDLPRHENDLSEGCDVAR